jgi:hypothetical protein
MGDGGSARSSASSKGSVSSPPKISVSGWWWVREVERKGADVSSRTVLLR